MMAGIVPQDRLSTVIGHLSGQTKLTTSDRGRERFSLMIHLTFFFFFFFL